jgi:5-formyltetrahydrofolate cyclo-ligase
MAAQGETATLAAKKGLRETSLAARARLTPPQRSAAADGIARLGLGFLGPLATRRISAYSALEPEMDPAPLLARLHGEGHQLCLPVIVGRGQPLQFRAWAPGDPTQAKTWGIREPLPSAPVVVPDILLVPLLAVDRRGWRLGYGGGFYDRTLRALRASGPVIAVGLAYDIQVVDAVPHSVYDERLDWVLTPSGPHRCNPPAAET